MIVFNILVSCKEYYKFPNHEVLGSIDTASG